MRPEVYGLIIAGLILAPMLVPIYLRAFRRDHYGERFGRYEYRIIRSGSFVFEGTSFRKEVPEALDWVAQQVLEEWFASKDGEAELINVSARRTYRCVVFLKGYGAGEAWGK